MRLSSYLICLERSRLMATSIRSTQRAGVTSECRLRKGNFMSCLCPLCLRLGLCRIEVVPGVCLVYRFVFFRKAGIKKITGKLLLKAILRTHFSNAAFSKVLRRNLGSTGQSLTHSWDVLVVYYSYPTKCTLQLHFMYIYI